MESDRSRSQPRQRAALVNSRSRDTRQALVRAALELWSEPDFAAAYDATTPADIARAAGVSKGTFYFHFANKDAVLLEMSSSMIDAMLAQVATGAARGSSVTAVSEELMSLVTRRVARTPKAAALRAGTLGVAGRADGQVSRAPRLAVAFESLVRYGTGCGDLDADTDVEETAAMLTALTAEAIIRWGRDDRTTAWLEQTLQHRVAVVLRGIGPGAAPPSGSTAGPEPT